MAAFEVIALDTATPQLRAPGASDTYTFPRAVEMPLGTANGVLYLNASKVATSGSALTFDGSTFAVNSAASIGSNTAKTKFYSDSTYNGIFNGASLTAAESVYMGSGGLFFFTSGSEQMRLDSTGLGIGTSSPGAKLDVQTTGQEIANLASSNANGGYMTLGRVGALSIIGSYLAASGGGVVLPSADALYFRSSNGIGFGSGGAAPTAFLDTSGNLGLGVTPSASWFSGAAALQFGVGGGLVSSSSYTGLTRNTIATSAGFAAQYLASAAASMYLQGNGTHEWYTAASGTAGNTISFTQAMTLDASGNLTLGQTSSALQSGGTGITLYGSSASELKFLNSTTGQLATDGTALVTSGSDFVINNREAGAITFGTSNTERARIPAAGGMVVGTAALATTATDGFLYVPTCAGTPTGTPTTQTGTAPIVVDTTNNKLYFYSGGQWRDAGP